VSHLGTVLTSLLRSSERKETSFEMRGDSRITGVCLSFMVIGGENAAALIVTGLITCTFRRSDQR
jgi:hypothetical protein